MGRSNQGGNVVVGIIIGVVLGLGAALAVAVYVTKVPVPFLNKGTGRSAEQDAAETRKNQNWDPNAPLYGKNPARPMAPAPAGAASGPAGVLPLPPPLSAADKQDSKEAAKEKDKDKGDKADRSEKAAPKKSSDPLGDLAAAKAGMPTPPAVAGGDPFLYFVQAGAFRTAEDAEAQRAKLSLMGVEAKVTEREQSGRQVWRVRIGPFNSKEEADRNKEKLESGGVETALVRVQR